MNDRKKILFLVTQSEFGGAQRFIYTLVNSLKNHDIVVSAGKEGDDENGILNLLEKQGIKVERLKSLKRSINPLFDFCFGLVEIYKLLKKEKPDILFLCSSKAGAMGSLVGRLVGVDKIIYRIGGWTFNDPRNFLINSCYKLIEIISAKWKDYIINNSTSDKQQAIKLGIRPKKEIRVIYNGIDTKNVKFLNRKEAREFLNLNDADFVVGTIANDYPAKGLKYLKEAVVKIQGAKCVIIGKGNLFLSDAYKYLKAFDVFVLPSVKEGFPWVILEAMTVGIPIIATRVGAVPEIIEDGENGLLIDPSKTEQIVEAIEKLFKHKELGAKLVKGAQETVIEKFNLSKMVKQYEDLFFID